MATSPRRRSTRPSSRPNSSRRPYRPSLELLECRQLLSGSTASSETAYAILQDRLSAVFTNFYVYQDVDSGFNHGFPSGYFAGDAQNMDLPNLRTQISVDPACVNDPNSPTGCSTDPNAWDRSAGTIARLDLPPLQATQYTGLNFEEPEQYTTMPGSRGYDLTGVTRFYVDARSPSPGGIDVQFGVGGRNTNRATPFHLGATWHRFIFDLASLRDPNTNAPAPPNLSNVHVLFTVVESATYERDGGIVLLDNIRLDPPPNNPLRLAPGQARPSFPLGNETFGVLPAVISATDDGDPGFSVTGGWSHETGRTDSYKSDRYTIQGGDGSAVASWAFQGLQPRVYEVQATWAGAPNQATNASFTLFGDGVSQHTAMVDQTQMPPANKFDGSKWQSLGEVRVTTGSLRVDLSNAGVNPAQTVVADGVRLVPTIPPDQAIRNLTTTYESSLTVFALLDRGTVPDLTYAHFLADTFLHALTHDSTGGNAQMPSVPGQAYGLRDSYSSGDLIQFNNQGTDVGGALAGQDRLAGFSSDMRLCGPTGFCLVLDGSFGGNNAFAILALLAAYRRFGEVKYLDGARQIGRWVYQFLVDKNGPAFNSNPATQSYGGYFLGYPDKGVVKDPVASLIRGKSIENNGDLFAAYSGLAAAELALGRAADADKWTQYANIAGDFVMVLYDPGDPNNPRDGHFNTGVLYDPPGPEGPPTGPGLEPSGPTRGTDVLNVAKLLDSNTFTTLPLARSAR